MVRTGDWLAELLLSSAPYAEPSVAIGGDALAADAERTAAIHALNPIFDWRFQMLPPPDKAFGTYEQLRHAALQSFIGRTEHRVRRADRTLKPDEPLVGWVGSAPLDDGQVS